MQVLIQFTRTGCHTVLGNFAPGDRLRCAPDMARHFVDGVRCARYVDQQPVPQAVPKPARSRRARRSEPNPERPNP